jgi:hypothetical protein
MSVNKGVVSVVEIVELHGGPWHGDKVDLPFERSPSLQYQKEFEEDGQIVQKYGKYTRVHDVSNRPTKDFEWVGWSPSFP